MCCEGLCGIVWYRASGSHSIKRSASSHDDRQKRGVEGCGDAAGSGEWHPQKQPAAKVASERLRNVEISATQ